MVVISPNAWLAPYTNFFITLLEIASASSLLDSIPDIVCFLTFSNSSVFKAGCRITSDNKDINLGKLFFKELTEAN